MGIEGIKQSIYTGDHVIFSHYSHIDYDKIDGTGTARLNELKGEQ